MLNQKHLTGLAAYLYRDGLLEKEIAQNAMELAQEHNITFTYCLVKFKILASEIIFDYCAKNFDITLFHGKDFDINNLVKYNIPEDLIIYHRIFPLYQDTQYLYVGITNPTEQEGINAIAFHTGLIIRPILISESQIDDIIKLYFSSSQDEIVFANTLAKLSDPIKPQTIINEEDELVIKFVDQLLQDAINKNASDIHIEPFEKFCRIRFRCDGMLQEVTTIPLPLTERVVTRIKILANLNIAERRLPHDGRINLANHIDLRVSTCPVLYGEKIVLRILNTHKITIDIDTLNLPLQHKKIFLNKLNQPQGLILVTGPTGSGKTTTLYSALNYLNKIEKNISTVEDPVEIQIHGINQISINPKINLNFADILRNLLRQDPDIMMIGEIRDSETANIAIQAAHTGHLVLSTMHTNSALETIRRLHAMNIPTYHLLNSLSLIIAQRLLRKLCVHCKHPNPVNEPYPYRAAGCNHCHHGYHGRVAIFELVVITEKIMQKLLLKSDVTQQLKISQKSCEISLWDAALAKVMDGTTDYAEMLRIVGEKP